MTDKPFDVRAELMSTISKTDESKDRAMLMLMLGVLERVEHLLTDRDHLRLRVLNGLSDVHEGDHEWIEQQRAAGCHDICAWAKVKMEQEALDKADTRARYNAILTEIGGKAVWLFLGMAVYALAAGGPLLQNLGR